MKNIPSNSKSTQIDERFSQMVQQELKSSIIMGGTVANMVSVLSTYKTPKVIFLVEDSEILENEIKVYYRQEDDPDEVEDAIDRIPISEFCAWMKKHGHNVIIPEAHNHQGIFTQGNPKEYDPEDILRDPIFERDLHLELFLSDRGY